MKRYAPYLLIGALICMAQFLGWLAPIDNFLIDQRQRFDGRAASGEVVLVDIDSRSLRAIDVWPWPRSIHGALVDKLNAAGAQHISFDIDFSSRSRDTEDFAFADALSRSEVPVVLAAVEQFVKDGEGRNYLSFNEPISVLLRHARIGLVNVFPGTDTFIRQFPAGADVNGARLASLPFATADIAYVGQDPIRIDYGIRPDTIPRYSYVDVLAGNVPDDALRGRNVIVGATALELGDQFAAPVYGVIDGPMLQALAFETIVQDRAISGVSVYAVLAALIALVAVCVLNSQRHWVVRGAMMLAAVALSQVAAFGLLHVLAIHLETAALGLIALSCFAFDLFKDIEKQAVTIFQQSVVMMHRGRTLNRILDDSFDGIITTDEDGRIEMFNPAAGEITGLNAGEAAGRTIEEIIPGASEPVRESLEHGDLEPGPLLIEPVELDLVRADKAHIPIEISVSRSTVPVADAFKRRSTEERPVYTYTFRDITRRKEAEAELRSSKESAESANRAKTEFLANMSHELRTPLNAVIGFSEIMKDESFGPLGTEEYVEYTGVIHDSGNHLLSIINDILDISRIETDSFELNEEPFDLGEALAACVRITQGWQQKQPRKFVVELSEDMPWIVGDERLVRQITLNLLSNAFKFTEDDTGTVTLRTSVSAKGDLYIEVADNGIGIPDDDIPRLTEAFYQVDGSLARSHDGTGLGLSLVKTFIEAHGGELLITSKLDVGTRVRVSIPAKRLCVPDAAAQDAHEAAIFAS